MAKNNATFLCSFYLIRRHPNVGPVRQSFGRADCTFSKLSQELTLAPTGWSRVPGSASLDGLGRPETDGLQTTQLTRAVNLLVAEWERRFGCKRSVALAPKGQVHDELRNQAEPWPGDRHTVSPLHTVRGTDPRASTELRHARHFAEDIIYVRRNGFGREATDQEWGKDGSIGRLVNVWLQLMVPRLLCSHPLLVEAAP